MGGTGVVAFELLREVTSCHKQGKTEDQGQDSGAVFPAADAEILLRQYTGQTEELEGQLTHFHVFRPWTDLIALPDGFQGRDLHSPPGGIPRGEQYGQQTHQGCDKERQPGENRIKLCLTACGEGKLIFQIFAQQGKHHRNTAIAAEQSNGNADAADGGGFEKDGFAQLLFRGADAGQQTELLRPLGNGDGKSVMDQADGSAHDQRHENDREIQDHVVDIVIAGGSVHLHQIVMEEFPGAVCLRIPLDHFCRIRCFGVKPVPEGLGLAAVVQGQQAVIAGLGSPEPVAFVDAYDGIGGFP